MSPVDLEGLASGTLGLVDFSGSDVNLGQLIHTHAALRVAPTESFLVDRERLSEQPFGRRIISFSALQAAEVLQHQGIMRVRGSINPFAEFQGTSQKGFRARVVSFCAIERSEIQEDRGELCRALALLLDAQRLTQERLCLRIISHVLVDQAEV